MVTAIKALGEGPLRESHVGWLLCVLEGGTSAAVLVAIAGVQSGAENNTKGNGNSANNHKRDTQIEFTDAYST